MPAIMDEECMSVASSATIKEEEESESMEDSSIDEAPPAVPAVAGPSVPGPLALAVASPSVPSPTTPWSQLLSPVPVVEGANLQGASTS